jgi:predicted DNA-binding protein
MAIRLTRKTQTRLNEYAARTGQTTNAVMNEAINYFYDNYGEIMMEELEERQARKMRKNTQLVVITFPGSRPA